MCIVVLKQSIVTEIGLQMKVDYTTIQLIGRWRSDQILRYLHVSARRIMQCHAGIMVANSNYSKFPAPTIDLLD